MKKFSDKYLNVTSKILSTPLSIAFLLTFATIIFSLVVKSNQSIGLIDASKQVAIAWNKGLWDPSTGGLYFAFQMMFMLVMGHTIALTPAAQNIIQALIKSCSNSAKSAFIVCFITIILSYFNWSLGLIFGAILARNIGEKFSIENKKINYPLIVSSAYTGMLIWHGGFSGSAPTKVMEDNSLNQMVAHPNISVPTNIPLEMTIGSSMNLYIAIMSIILLPLIVFFIGKKVKEDTLNLSPFKMLDKKFTKKVKLSGAEKIDFSRWFIRIIGFLIIIVCFVHVNETPIQNKLGFINPNFINLFLLGLTLVLHKHIHSFINSVQNAIGDISGILIQFPLYFGILGIMKEAGLIELISNQLISISTINTLPFYTFLSAGIVNFFVPSGGGQWAIQGPIIIQSVAYLNADLPKTIMAMAYGDQLTNMLQPFWALPLLGITKSKAKDILPYTFLFFVVGFILFGSALLIF